MNSFQKYLTDRFDLTNDEWVMIDQYIKRKVLRKGEFFFEQDKICKVSGFILEGVLRYFSYDSDGNDPTCYFSYENQYITDPFSFRKQIPSDMNLQAVITCEIAVISFAADKKLQEVMPRWSDITNQLLLNVSMDFANQKELLSMNASGRYNYFTKKFPNLASRVPLQFVASYLGIKQPSLSRVRKKATPGK